MIKTWNEISSIIDKEIKMENFALLVSPQECQIIYETAIRLRAKTILELGFGCGSFTTALLFACKETGGHLTTIDPDKEFSNANPQILNFIKKLKLDENWTFIEENDMDVEWNSKVDMLLIDTDHTLDLTVKELNKFMSFVKGEALLHDVLHNQHSVDINTAVLQYIRKDLPAFRWELIDVPKTDVWNYEVYNTWCGIGRLYKREMEGTNHIFNKDTFL
jgi:phospholipid N-methyltransferase